MHSMERIMSRSATVPAPLPHYSSNAHTQPASDTPNAISDPSQSQLKSDDSSLLSTPENETSSFVAYSDSTIQTTPPPTQARSGPSRPRETDVDCDHTCNPDFDSTSTISHDQIVDPDLLPLQPQSRIQIDSSSDSSRHPIRNLALTCDLCSAIVEEESKEESIYDAFGAGHSSTSISAGRGLAISRDLLGFLDSNLIIVLNDNMQVSLSLATLDGPAIPAGALSRALSKLRASTKLRKHREAAKSITKKIGGLAYEGAAKVDEYARGKISVSGYSLFEELGLYYIGPVNGHKIDDLVTIFRKVKSMLAPGPILVHVVTEKGKGYPPAEAATDKMHGVVKFDAKTGKQAKPKKATLSYTQYFAESLIREAEEDNKIVAIHIAMGGGIGLNYFQKKYPERCYDVGIAEQHVVTFVVGLTTEGLKPFSTIYSSSLQRGYDQVMPDIDLQRLSVCFAMDQEGLVGADGPTHCGAFNIAYMACLPNMIVMAPADDVELMHMVAMAADEDLLATVTSLCQYQNLNYLLNVLLCCKLLLNLNLWEICNYGFWKEAEETF